MGRFHNALLILSVLVSLFMLSEYVAVASASQPAGLQPGASAIPSPFQSLFSTQVVSQSNTSPVQQVKDYNNEYAMDLITCPIAPGKTYTTLSLISPSQTSTSWQPGERVDYAGNGCYTNTAQLNPSVKFKIAVSPPSSPSSFPVSSPDLQFSDIAEVNAVILGYNPMINITGNAPAGIPPQDIVSTSSGGNRYIYSANPTYGEQGLWTWSAAAYTNLGQLSGSLSEVQRTHEYYVPPGAPSCTPQVDQLATNWPGFANSFFGAALEDAGYPATTDNINFLEALGASIAPNLGPDGGNFLLWNPLGISTSQSSYGSAKVLCGYTPPGDKLPSTQEIAVFGNAAAGEEALAYEMKANWGSLIAPGTYLTEGNQPLSSFAAPGGIDSPFPGWTDTAADTRLSQFAFVENIDIQSKAPNPAGDMNNLLGEYWNGKNGLGSAIPSKNYCTYSYDYTSSISISNIQQQSVPFPIVEPPTNGKPNFGSLSTQVLPYLIYNYNITNPAPQGAYNLQLSYDLYSPWNYYKPQGRIEPVPLNSTSLFFNGGVFSINPASSTFLNPSLAYYNVTGLGQGLSQAIADTNFGLPYPESGVGIPTTISTGCAASQTGEPLYKIAWCDLIAAGYSQIEAAGIMGNAAQETGGQNYKNINPEQKSSGGGCNGFVCFTTSSYPTSPSLITGNPQLDIQNQIQLIITSGYGPGAAWWSGVTTPKGAAIAFMQNFERCSGYNNPPNYGLCNGPVRESQAQAAYSALASGLASGGASGLSSNPAATSEGVTFNIQADAMTATPNGFLYVVGTTKTAQTGQCPYDTGTVTADIFFQCSIWYGEKANNLQATVPSQYSLQFLEAVSYFEWESVGISGIPSLLWKGTEPFYNPLLITNGDGGVSCSNTIPGKQICSFSTAQAGEQATAKLMNSAMLSALVNGGSPKTIAGEIGSNFGKVENSFNEFLTSWQKAPFAGCQAVASALQSGTPLTGINNVLAWVCAPAVPDGSQTNTKSNVFSTPGLQLFVLKQVQPGYYNTSQYQPNSVQIATCTQGASAASTCSQTFASNWNTYWNNVLAMQTSSVYLANAIPLSSALNINVASTELTTFGENNKINMLSSGDIGGSTFVPLGMASDSLGDVYVTGYYVIAASASSSSTAVTYSNAVTVPAIVTISHANGNGPLLIQSHIVNCYALSQSPLVSQSQISSSSLTSEQQNELSSALSGTKPYSVIGWPHTTVWPEIAVSPDGSEIYLANASTGGYIVVLSGSNPNICAGAIDLSYSPDIVHGYSSTSAAGAVGAGVQAAISGIPVVGSIAADVQAHIDENGVGLNITNWLANGGFYGITPSQSANANKLQKAMSYIIGDAIPTSGDVAGKNNPGISADYLDKATYHHPVGIADVNGYLYVLDDWNGKTGEWGCGSSGIQELFPVIQNLYTSGCQGGIAFNFLTLRVINASGVDVPITPYIPPSSAGGKSDIWQVNQGGCGNSLSPGTGIALLAVAMASGPITAAAGLFGASKLEQECMTVTPYSGKYSGYGYPPYGWILSGQITAGGSGQTHATIDVSSDIIQGCITSQSETNVGCTTYPTSVLTYTKPYAPIGPQIASWSCTADNVGLFGFGPTFHHSCASTPLSGVQFSVSINNTVSIYVPSCAKLVSEGQFNGADCAWGGNGGVNFDKSPANLYGELLFLKFDLQNYTLPVGVGYPGTASYNCYTTDSGSSSYIRSGSVDIEQPLIWDRQDGITDAPKPQSPGLCQNYGQTSADLVYSINPPIYFFTNPFVYDQNRGYAQSLSLAQTMASEFGYGVGSSTNINNNPSAFTVQEGTDLESASSASSGTFLNNLIGGGTSQPSGTGQLATAENSHISGYVLFPYSYSYTLTQSIDNVNPVSQSACTGFAPPKLQQSTTQQTVYAYTQANVVPNYLNATVSGGSLYSEYGNGTLYVPKLGSVSLPPQVITRLLGNRMIGTAYVNITVPGTGVQNAQDIVNATSQMTFADVVATQQGGAFPGFSYISASANPGVPCYGPSCAQSFANAKNSFGSYSNFDAQNIYLPTQIALLYMNKIPTRVFNEQLFLNRSGTSYSKLLGYHRLIFAYADAFNNIIYQPIDADIANLTQINMTVTPIVNSTNANDTIINITGTAGWIPQGATAEIPLKNSPIYLYYDANLNTEGYNAISSYAQVHAIASQCIFNASRRAADSGCQLANPVYSGLQGTPNGQHNMGYVGPNVTTYNTQYNSTGRCSPPPSSLFTPIQYNCNIYNNDSLNRACPPYVTNSKGGTYLPPYPEYCMPIALNGSGICTSQLGLANITQTNAHGKFNALISACGYGYSKITAVYYGTPPPEPTTATQVPLGYSAYTLNHPTPITFGVFNYSWVPANQTVSVPIGTFLLGLGRVSAFALLAIAALVVAFAFMRTRTKKRISKKRIRYA
ncbi:MAG: phage tail tip lysozyme [Candidatus Marsarchaeota archaeon]|nr:phage tail tip lysozyme [Candidatus Marsarchaeota archaeon]